LKKSDLAGYYTLNLARTAVDACLERTQLTGIICEDEKSRNVLDAFWKYNELDFEAPVAHEKAYEFGHSVVVLMPNDDGQLEAYVHSPEDFTVFYDVARPRIKSHAIHTYISTNDTDNPFSAFDQSLYYFVEVYTPDVVQKWRSMDALIDGMPVDVSRLELTLVDEVPTAVPGVIPVFHFRTARTETGRSRLVDVAAPQIAFNDVLTGMMASIKAAAYRQRRGLFGATWADVFQYVLAFNNMELVDAAVDWAPFATDDKDWWETQEIKVGLGMPKKVAFVQSGVDQETVDGWFDDAEEDAQQNQEITQPETNAGVALPNVEPEVF
jgi:hypothetical protein